MNPLRQFYGKKLYAALIATVLLVTVLLTGSLYISDSSNSAINSASRTSSQPLNRDFEEITDSGTLRMITRYNSSTYFLHQGMEVGFEYEFLKDFANRQNLDLEVVIIGPDDNPLEMLNSGIGDVIAANLTVTPELESYVNFTNPYNSVSHLIVYSESAFQKPATVEGLAGSDVTITVPKNSPYHERLIELREEGHKLDIDIVDEELDSESLLLQVANGTIQATVADDHIFEAAGLYMDGLLRGPEISRDKKIAWAIRTNSPELEARLNDYLSSHFVYSDDLEKPKRSEFLNILKRRYFEGSTRMAEYFNPDWYYTNSGLITPFDEIIKSVADSTDIDWLMLAAIIAQESKFNPQAESWAGAVGLMQILPRFSQVDTLDLYIPEINIREGARIFQENLDHYSYLDRENQIAFALATYNVGIGHMADARRLVIEMNKDPNQWENVEEGLIRLMQTRYNQDLKYGYARGIETVNYVNQVMNRYLTYQRVATVTGERYAANSAMISSLTDVQF